MGLTIERKKKKEKEPLEYATRDCAFQTHSKRISDSALNTVVVVATAARRSGFRLYKTQMEKKKNRKRLEHFRFMEPPKKLKFFVNVSTEIFL
jgi:hypothetical protein